MSTPTVQFMMPHHGQETILQSPARFRVVACGRRFGKTAVGKILIVENAMRGAACWWLAPTYLMASEVWRDLKAALRDIPGLTTSEADHRLAFVNGGSITIRSTHQPDLLRGAGLDFVVLDEAAFMEPTVWPQIVRPMLADRRGGAIFLSTPYGHNWFWDLFKIGLDPEEDEWQSFHYPTTENALIEPSEIEAIRRNTPERVFREEYLAEFISDSGQVFRGITEAATAPLNAAPQSNAEYVGGIDWGREDDYTCVTLINRNSGQMVAMERFRKVSWAMQRDRLRALVDRWQPSVLWAEANSMGTVNIEALQAEGVPVRPFNTTSHSKTPLIEALALAIERQEITLMPDPVLLAELASYRLERLPGGGHRYSAPPGTHDDTVIALALAWHGMRSGSVRLDFV